MRNTKQKRIILNTLKMNPIHPTAEMLYSLLIKKLPKISLATVYRNLNLFVNKNIIKEIRGLDNSVHYDHNTCEHFHIICEKCSKIIDIESKYVVVIKNRLQELTKYKIKSYDVLVKGICPECAKEK